MAVMYNKLKTHGLNQWIMGNTFLPLHLNVFFIYWGLRGNNIEMF